MSFPVAVFGLLLGAPAPGGDVAASPPPAAAPPSTTAPETTKAPPSGKTPPRTAAPTETSPPPPAETKPPASSPSAGAPDSTAAPPTEPPAAAAPPSGSPPSGDVKAPAPPGGSPPAPPPGATDAALAPQEAQAAAAKEGAGAAADLGAKVADRAKDAAERVAEGAADRGDEAPPEEDSREPSESAPRQSLTDTPREPIGTEWDDDEVERERVVTVVHDVAVRPLPPPPEPYQPEPIQIGGYGGLSVRGSALNRNPSVWVGARGALILANRFSIGGAFYEATARFGGAIVGSRGERLGLRAAYGGMTFDWVAWEHGKLDIGIESLVGAGAACVSRSPGYGDDDWRCIETVRMFVVEPGVNVTYTVRDWLRVGTSLGWRFVARQAWRPPNDFSLAGPYFALNLDFGWFGENR